MATKAKDIFEYFGTDENGKPRAPDNSNTAQLAQRLAELEASNAQLQRANQALMTQAPAAPATYTPPEAPKLDLSGLPDQYADPDAWNKAFNERVASYVEGTISSREAVSRAQQTQAQTQQQKIDNLWNGFSAMHPELAKHTDVIEFVATKVLTAKKAANIDIDRYAFANPDAFYNDVVEEARKFNPSLFAAEQTEEDADDIFNSQGDPNILRTGGILGGQESGGKPTRVEQDKPGDFLADIKALQKSSGFF